MIIPLPFPGNAPQVRPEAPAREEGRRVEGRARELGLIPLREARVPHGDLELRLWSGFSWGLHMIRLVRTRDAWSGQRLEIAPDGSRLQLAPLAAPKDGWNRIWLTLKAFDLLTIPNAAILPDDGVRLADGAGYLFEVRTGTHFRAVFYDNPQEHPAWPSARGVTRMIAFLRRELPPRSVE